MAKLKTSFSLTPQAREHLATLAQTLGTSQSAALEILIRAGVPAALEPKPRSAQ